MESALVLTEAEWGELTDMAADWLNCECIQGKRGDTQKLAERIINTMLATHASISVPEEKYLLYACETCQTFSPNDPLVKHSGHHVIGIEGADYDEASRVAAAHLVLAKRIRAGDQGGLATDERV